MSHKYNSFLAKKRIIAKPVGFDINASQLNQMLFDWQQVLTKWAIKKGRAALFEGCGLGKTPQQLEWAEKIYQKTNKPALILAPLAVSMQTRREGIKFGIDVNICKDHSDVKRGINITNYERLEKFKASEFSSIVLDESSIIKNFAGKIRNQIIDAFRSTPYKLACTATPAPNDYTELGNTAEFLGIMTRPEMLSMFFINDTSDTGTWRLKGHAKENAFWQWLCSWAVTIRKPSDIGYPDDKFILPELKIIPHVIPYRGPKTSLFVEPANTLSEIRQAMKESLGDRVERAADLANNSAEQWLIWCNLNSESEALTKAISGAVEIKGSDSIEHKETAMLDFSDGNIKCLVTKPRIAGFGMNWQTVHNMAFVGLSHSYEQFYQALRRCWRFGQQYPVNAHVITGEREGNVVENIKRKESDMDSMYSGMASYMHRFMDYEIDAAYTQYAASIDMELPKFLEVAQ